jgi:hypothetical protein
VPSAGARLPRPVAVTVAVRFVVVVVKIEVELDLTAVVLGNRVGTLVQLLTRLATFTLPKPVASLYPALLLNADSNEVVEAERTP